MLQQLFGSTDSNIRQTDIVMLLTPRIVRSHELTRSDLAPIYIGPQSNLSLGGGPPPLINVPAAEPPAAAPPVPAAPVSRRPMAPRRRLRFRREARRFPGSRPCRPTPPPTPAEPPPVPPATAGCNAAEPPPTPPPTPTPETQPSPGDSTAAGRRRGRAHHARGASRNARGRQVRTPCRFPISGASRLSTISLSISFNPAVLRVRSVQEGTFMRQGGITPTFTQQVDATAGRIDIAITRPGDQTGAQGTGLLAAVLFEPVAAGQTALTITGVGTVVGGGPAVLSLRRRQ